MCITEIKRLTQVCAPLISLQTGISDTSRTTQANQYIFKKFLMSTSTIRHIIAMPSDVAESRLSYFQGFSCALFPDYLEIFKTLTYFPHDIAEPYLSGNTLILSKMLGSCLDVYMIRADLIDHEHIDLNRPLNIIWSTASSIEPVESRLNYFTVRPLHITVGDHPGAISISTLTRESISLLLEELLSRAAESDTKLSKLRASITQHSTRTRNEGRLPFSPRLHNCTAPLIELLRLYGYQIDNGIPIKPSEDIDQYIEAMLQLVRVIDNLRPSSERNPPKRKNDVLIFCPSAYTYLYRADSQHWNTLYRKLDRARRNFLKNALIRNRGYGNSTLQVDEENIFNPYEDEIIAPLLRDRQFELSFFTLIISLVASNQFVPALRLPNAVMLHHDKLRNIYNLINSNHKNRRLKLSHKIAEYSRTLQDDMGTELVKAAFSSREKLLAVCDFPIEWLAIDLVPAMFRYEISRTPSTPGNVVAHTLLSGQRVVIPFSAARDILIIRSFTQADPIRNHLLFAIDHFSTFAGLENLRLSVVDVNSEIELVEALNAFNGMIVIFDCHGNHGGEESHAWLHIGQDKVDTWQLANRARIPPIAILAACSTHALDGSHASVANGLLRSGAISVIGTLAPIDATHTGVTIARLLYRMSMFVPLVTKHRLYSWREIVSGFLRMSYASDILKDLCNEVGAISEAQCQKINIDANCWINSGDPAWIDKLFDSIMSITGMNSEAIRKIWAERYQFVDTMLLVQLGRPENIMISNDFLEDKEKNPLVNEE